MSTREEALELEGRMARVETKVELCLAQLQVISAKLDKQTTLGFKALLVCLGLLVGGSGGSALVAMSKDVSSTQPAHTLQNTP